MYSYKWSEESTPEELMEQRASHVGQSLRRGERPQIILESDRENLNLTPEEMANMGYYWDAEKGHWIYGELLADAPQSYGAVAPYGYGGSGYPQYGSRGGGGGYVGGDYTYPQSFVGREQRGATPQINQNRAARFGAVTWRI
jgi:hypothetical protein